MQAWFVTLLVDESCYQGPELPLAWTWRRICELYIYRIIRGVSHELVVGAAVLLGGLSRGFEESATEDAGVDEGGETVVPEDVQGIVAGVEQLLEGPMSRPKSEPMHE